MIARVLLCVEQPSLARAIRSHVGSADVDVLVAQADGVGTIWPRLQEEPYDLLLLEGAPRDDDQTAVVRRVRELPDPPAVAVLSRTADAERRAELVAAGALAVIDPGVESELLAGTLTTLLTGLVERTAGEARRRREEECAGRLSDFASESPAMRAFLTTTRRVVRSDSTLLLLGETGVGKEYLARAIHQEGPRSSGPFVAVHCAALPESLLESELFGHVAGAFTGASRAHRGCFELANGGTLFLDEVGEMAPHVQVKLLQVLQSREFRPVGGEKALSVNVRVVAATNRDLKAEVAGGRFRSDLYYRLGVVALTVPPLRARPEDVRALVESHVEHFRRVLAAPVFGVTREAMELCARYHWPGNVRELINVVERAVLLTEGEEIGVEDLPEELRAPAHAAERQDGVTTPDVDRPYRDAREIVVDRFERRYFPALLEASGGRVGDAARRAGLTPRALYDKMKRLGLRKEDFRPAARAAPTSPRDARGAR